jgi:hypothetical protein
VTGSAIEIQGMIAEWQAEGTKGAMFLVSVQQMTKNPFLHTLSPRSCKLRRRLLIMNDVLIDAGAGCQYHQAILKMEKKNPTFQSADHYPNQGNVELIS